MEWKDFKDYEYGFAGMPNAVKTDIKCPKCGQPIYMRTDIVLTSYPVQFSYFCDCGWAGYSTRKWSNK